MYRKILVPLDGSYLAEQVLPHVEELARCMGAKIILLRVLVFAYDSAPTALSPYRRTLFPEEVEDPQEHEAKEYLERMATELCARGLDCSFVLAEHMPPAEGIAQFARENEIDLIAMSTHGYTGVPRAIFGSVADNILRHAGKPVLLIQPSNKSAKST